MINFSIHEPISIKYLIEIGSLANEAGSNFTEVTWNFILSYFALHSLKVSTQIALNSEVSTQTRRNASAIAIASALIAVYNIYNIANEIL